MHKYSDNQKHMEHLCRRRYILRDLYWNVKKNNWHIYCLLAIHKFQSNVLFCFIIRKRCNRRETVLSLQFIVVETFLYNIKASLHIYYKEIFWYHSVFVSIWSFSRLVTNIYFRETVRDARTNCKDKYCIDDVSKFLAFYTCSTSSASTVYIVVVHTSTILCPSVSSSSHTWVCVWYFH